MLPFLWTKQVAWPYLTLKGTRKDNPTSKAKGKMRISPKTALMAFPNRNNTKSKIFQILVTIFPNTNLMFISKP